MKQIQMILTTAALGLLLLGLGVGIHKAYTSSFLVEQDEDIQLVENLPDKSLPYMQAQDIASILLIN